MIGRAAAMAPLLVASTAAALTPAVLVGPNLESQTVTVAGLRGDRLVYFDDQRRLCNESTSEFVQLRAIGGDEAMATDATDAGEVEASDPTVPTAPTPPRSVVELSDGQRFVGGLHMAGDEDASPAVGGDLVLWDAAGIGIVRLRLDRIRSLELAQSAAAEADAAAEAGAADNPPAADRVAPAPPAPAEGAASDFAVLTNGDIVVGFVESLSDAAVVIAPRQGPAITVPLQRIAALRLANPPTDLEPVDPAAHMLVLRDGARLRVVDLELDGEQVSFRLPLAVESADRLNLPLARVARIDFIGSGWRLVDLADRPISIQAGGEVFGLPWPVRTGGGAIRLHAPIRVAIELPPGARRFAAAAALDLDAAAPPSVADWADVDVVVESTDVQPHRVHLDSDRPRAAINAPVHGPTLWIELDPAINGPILDRVRLEQAVLLVQTPVVQTDSSSGP